MEDIKLEVQIVGDGLVKTNAEQVLEVIEYGLKSYRYVVNESNYDQAKKDRAALNKLIKNLFFDIAIIVNNAFNIGDLFIT